MTDTTTNTPAELAAQISERLDRVANHEHREELGSVLAEWQAMAETMRPLVNRTHQLTAHLSVLCDGRLDTSAIDEGYKLEDGLDELVYCLAGVRALDSAVMACGLDPDQFDGIKTGLLVREAVGDTYVTRLAERD